MRSTGSITSTARRGTNGSVIASNSPHQRHYLVQPPGGWQIGTRLSHFDYGGYVPIGFFQMWNRESKITRYPTTQDAGASTPTCCTDFNGPDPTGS